MTHALGLDFGTGSVRALIVDLARGAEAAAATCGYAHGDGGVVGDPRDPDLARQHPADYLVAMRTAVREAVARAAVDPAAIAGIGVDTTGSTPIPVDAAGTPLALVAAFADRPDALAWLWKDHTAQAEAEEITALARERRPAYLARCGGTYSSEWFWAKLLRCRRVAPDVFAAAASWVELADWVPAWLCGRLRPGDVVRDVCAAGHKAMYSAEWGGYPDAEFLTALDPALGAVRATLTGPVQAIDRPVGRLAAAPAEELGLRPGTPVATGAFDAHLGAVGAGVGPGDLVKVVGTSTCDMTVVRGTDLTAEIRGLCGAVDGSILPGWIGLEAGQSAVGDVFAWCTRLVGRPHDELEREALGVRPGASGLLALDWHNGNRSVLVDPALSGAVLGLNLHTTAAELYRAMVEGTAFGARVIVERMVECGVPVERVIACGGIAQKSALVMQVYADVLGRPVAVSGSAETCALGAAIAGAVAAGRFTSVEEGQRALCAAPARTYRPGAAARRVYDELFEQYRAVHDAFGVAGATVPTAAVMKRVLAIRAGVRADR